MSQLVSGPLRIFSPAPLELTVPMVGKDRLLSSELLWELLSSVVSSLSSSWAEASSLSSVDSSAVLSASSSKAVSSAVSASVASSACACCSSNLLLSSGKPRAAAVAPRALRLTLWEASPSKALLPMAAAEAPTAMQMHRAMAAAARENLGSSTVFTSRFLGKL
ncbi:MAG: hypothetical protein LUB63_06420 [Oscillospiraceae bacterium]|nr:hypothetical protein [Oscillospiraceae bacterium]